jgi:hypothetical protein
MSQYLPGNGFTHTYVDGVSGSTGGLRTVQTAAEKRSAFIERYLVAVAQGGKVASAEFDIPHAANLFDALYPEQA